MKFHYRDRVKVTTEGFFKNVVGVVVSFWLDYRDNRGRTPRYSVSFVEDPKQIETFWEEDLERSE